MYLKLRIIFTILAAICAALVLPVGTFGGFLWAIVAVLGAVMFFLLMLVCKQSQEKREKKDAQEPSFFEPQDNETKDKNE